MTFNDLEPPKEEFLWFFSQLNCDEMIEDRPRQPAYEIFSNKRWFYQSKSQPPRFKEVGAGGRRIRQQPPPLKVVILPLLSRVAWKRLQLGTDMLLIITSNSDKLFIWSMTLNDREPLE